MPSLRPITIVGGGLAGLTLGLGLRRRGIPVTVWEASGYPRHRVCGEFVCGRGQAVLARLGLRNLLLDARAITADDVAFFQGTRASPVRPVTPPALCLSRFALDKLLADELRARGGELLEHRPWQGESAVEGVVHASGRRRHRAVNGWRWLGLKAHARGVHLAAALEMHALEDGYVGLCRLPGEVVNVCGLFRRPSESKSPAPSWRELLSGPPGSSLHLRLADATFEEGSFCSVAGLTLRPAQASAQTDCRIGDALTMIPPVTGNGMSMALEAAEIAVEPLSAWSSGRTDWDQSRQTIAQACDRAFGRRLAWARWLQWLMFTPLARGRLGVLALKSDWLWQVLFVKTR